MRQVSMLTTGPAHDLVRVAREGVLLWGQIVYLFRQGSGPHVASQQGDPGGGIHQPGAQTLQKAPQRYRMITCAAGAPGPHQRDLLIATTEALHPEAPLERREMAEFTNDNQLPGAGARRMAETARRFLLVPAHVWTLASTPLG